MVDKIKNKTNIDVDKFIERLKKELSINSYYIRCNTPKYNFRGIIYNMAKYGKRLLVLK